MTEEEAKTKWCCGPPSLVNATVMPAGKLPDKSQLRCLGSACMAWRWIEDAEFLRDSDRAFARDGTELKPNRGFCGLAGAPR